MRKALSIVLAAALIIALASCKRGGGIDASTEEAAPHETTVVQPIEVTATTIPPATAKPHKLLVEEEGLWNPDNINTHTFVLAHGMAETSMASAQCHVFALAVEKLSGGKMQVNEAIDGRLFMNHQTYRALNDGAADFIYSIGSYISGIVVDIQPLTLPGYYCGDDWLSFANDTHELISSIYNDYNIKYLGTPYSGASVIACNTKQIKQPGDVKGLAWHASGNWSIRTLEAWGGMCRPMPHSHRLYDAFENGYSDGVMTGMGIIVPLNLYEVIEYLTVTTMADGFTALLMNGELWKGLNADEQMLIEEASKIFERRAYDIAIEFMEKYIKLVEDIELNEIYYLTPDEQKQFVEISYSLYPETEENTGLGSKGLELIALLREINGLPVAPRFSPDETNDETVIYMIENAEQKEQELLANFAKIDQFGKIKQYNGKIYASSFLCMPEWSSVPLTYLDRMAVIADHIYCISPAAGDDFPTALYRTDLQGGDITVIANNALSHGVLFAMDDKIVYQAVYYYQDEELINRHYDLGMFCYDANTSNTVKLTDDFFYYFLYDDEFVYYQKEDRDKSDTVWRVRWDGGQLERVAGLKVPIGMGIVESEYYYILEHEHSYSGYYSSMYRDGVAVISRYSINGNEKLNSYPINDRDDDSTFHFMTICNGCAYLSNHEGIYKMDVNTGEKKKIADLPEGSAYGTVTFFAAVEDVLYIAVYFDAVEWSETARLYKVSVNGGDMEFLNKTWGIV
jgi:TRAP-type C4-dicarboxylate transport system substrate-binding protein